MSSYLEKLGNQLKADIAFLEQMASILPTLRTPQARQQWADKTLNRVKLIRLVHSEIFGTPIETIGIVGGGAK